MRCCIGLSILFLLFACNGEGLYTLKHDPRGQLLLNKNWWLYSEDLIDTSNGKNNYVSRELTDTCAERIVFMAADTLVQYDSCKGQTAESRVGGWSWYLPDGVFSAQIYNSPEGQSLMKLYHYSEDSLQVEMVSGLTTDTANAKAYLRVRTYVNK